MPTVGFNIPSGIIVMWSGAIANIPTGFFLCDGTNGTPNLTDRFVIHADADSAGTRNVGATGGSHTSDVSHNHGGFTGPSVGGASGGTVLFNLNLTEHRHAISTDGSTTLATIPKFYALAYIMKS